MSKIHRYLPNSVPEIKERMMDEIGVSSIADLYSDIPDELVYKGSLEVPGPSTEAEVKAHVSGLLEGNATLVCPPFMGGGVWPRWSADGSRLYYRSRRDVMAVDFETEPAVRLGTPTRLFEGELTGQDIPEGRPDAFTVSGDGRFLLVRRAQRGREAAAATGIVLVENWFAEFRDSR